MITLNDTVSGMLSDDYKERFRAEYAQTKIRYEKLKAFNTRLEAHDMRMPYEAGLVSVLKPENCPKHNCPFDLLRRQQEVMGEYLHILEIRAVMENIDL